MHSFFYWTGFVTCIVGVLLLVGMMLAGASMIVSECARHLLRDLRAVHDIKLLRKCLRDLDAQGKTKLQREASNG